MKVVVRERKLIPTVVYDIELGNMWESRLCTGRPSNAETWFNYDARDGMVAGMPAAQWQGRRVWNYPTTPILRRIKDHVLGR